MITFNILAHDGTLYPTWARYKGCTYFCDGCREITVEDVLEKVRNRILYRLNKLSEGNLGSEIRVYEDCPSDRFPEDVKKPRIELFAFKLDFAGKQFDFGFFDIFGEAITGTVFIDADFRSQIAFG